METKYIYMDDLILTNQLLRLELIRLQAELFLSQLEKDRLREIPKPCFFIKKSNFF